MVIVSLALIAVWFVVIPVAVARATRDRTGGRLAFLFVLMLFLTAIWGALVFLFAHSWYRRRVPAPPVSAIAPAPAADIAGPEAG